MKFFPASVMGTAEWTWLNTSHLRDNVSACATQRETFSKEQHYLKEPKWYFSKYYSWIIISLQFVNTYFLALVITHRRLPLRPSTVCRSVDVALTTVGQTSRACFTSSWCTDLPARGPALASVAGWLAARLLAAVKPPALPETCWDRCSLSM